MIKAQVLDLEIVDLDNEIVNLSNTSFISVNDFLSIFGDAELNHESLVSHEKATEESGWLPIFNQWKASGLID